MSFLEFYKGKKVLITGHTGFKGSWLSIWLHKLGAELTGYALDPENDQGNFLLSRIGDQMNDIRGDINDLDNFFDVVKHVRPDIIFHLAAQPIVFEGYKKPHYTFQTNVMGTVNVLEAMRKFPSIRSAVFITTDKVYDNQEWDWPYRESDRLGGYDPYSSSKAACELVIGSYRKSFFQNEGITGIASARAGNVIGGGDWAPNRIVPDCFSAIENNKAIEIRNPKAIRPWQHVIEPLAGYLMLGEKLFSGAEPFTEAWNFGPEPDHIVNVESLVEKLIGNEEGASWIDVSQGEKPHETFMLTLDISKVKRRLGWKPLLSFDETVRFTSEWYRSYKSVDVLQLCLSQIDYYEQKLSKSNESQ